MDIVDTYAVPPWLTGFAPTGHYTALSSFAEQWARTDPPSGEAQP
jgi:hypothetical protein